MDGAVQGGCPISCLPDPVHHQVDIVEHRGHSMLIRRRGEDEEEAEVDGVSRKKNEKIVINSVTFCVSPYLDR